MKKTLLIILLAACTSLLTAQDRTAGESPDLQTELKTLHSTIRALQRSQAAQKKTFNILAARIDSLQGAVRTTQRQTEQAFDSVAVVAKVQADHSQRLDAVEVSLETRTVLLILALLALAALSLVVFFTLKKAIGEASEVMAQAMASPATAAANNEDRKTSSPLIVESQLKKTAVRLPIEPELFEAPVQHTIAPEAAPESMPELHVAIAEMIAAPERTEKAAEPRAHKASAKPSAHCHGVTKAGSQCKRKPVAGTHFCTQHTK